MRKILLPFLVLFSMLSFACSPWQTIKPDEVAVELDGGQFLRCVPPGVWSSWRWFGGFQRVSTNTLTFEVSDESVATKDTQSVSLDVQIQARRRGDCDSTQNLIKNWSSLLDDAKLQEVISSTAGEGMKTGTRQYTLTQLLDDRDGLATAIRSALEADADQYSVDIVNVTVKNVGIGGDYEKVLEEKALLTIQIETELKRQDLIKQQAANDRLAQEQKTSVLQAQLETERAQTEVQSEIASRDGKLIEARNAVYELNEKAYELERLRLLKDVLGDKAVVYFIPQGTDLSVFLTNPGQPLVVPDSN